VRLSIKIAVLSAVLAVDIFFFLFFGTYFPEEYELVFQMLPWSNDLEKTVGIIIGFVGAILVSFSIARLIIRQLLNSIRRG